MQKSPSPKMNTQKIPSNRHRIRIVPPFSLLLLSLPACGASAWATTDTWNGGSGNWNAANWTPSIPGSTSVTNNSDTAVFNDANNDAITVDSNRNLANIMFDAGVGSFTLSGGNFLLSNGGTLQLTSTVISTGQTETISSPITLEGGYTFSNNAGTSDVLSIGSSITSAASSGVTTLTLSGTATGTNILSGNISNGGGTNVVAITKSGTGIWTLSGNNSYSGTVTLNAGQLNIGSSTALGSGTFTINGGTIDNLAGPLTLTNPLAGTSAGFTFLGTNNLTFSNPVGLLAFNQPTNIITLGGVNSSLSLGGTASFNGSGGNYTFTVNGAGIRSRLIPCWSIPRASRHGTLRLTARGT